MGFMDKAKETAKKVADSAQDAVGDAKDKGQELLLKRKINGWAEDIGHLVLRQRAGETGLDDEIDRLVSEVRAAEAEIDALDEEEPS